MGNIQLLSPGELYITAEALGAVGVDCLPPVARSPGMSIFDTSTDTRQEVVSKTLQYRGAVYVVEHVVTYYYRADGTLGGLSQSPVYSVYSAVEDEDGVVTRGEPLGVATGDAELETMLGFFKKGGQ